MRVLFLGLVVSDMNSSTNLYSELIQEFHKNGHDIFVVAPVREKTRPGLQKEGGVPILRIKTMELFGVGKIYKAIANLLLPVQFYRALRAHKIDLDFDLILIPTPPITLYPLARKIKRKFGSKVYLILRDIFPQNAVDLKMMREGGAAHRFFRAQEKALYKICDGIGCMSPGNAGYILRHNPEIPASIVHQLPNWRRVKPYPVHNEDALVRQKYGFDDKFIVMFGGNIGKPQKVENIVALARACEDQKDIFFAVFGEGTEKQHLIHLITDSGLSNIHVFDGVSGQEYLRILQVADVGLISLSEDFTIPNTPSKVLAYFNAKKPILAAIDKNTDIGAILESVGAGVWAEANKTNELKKLLLKLYHQPELRKEMGENGYRYLVQSLTPELAYETVIREMTT
jgi:glycosyltransferase involved in cell wall biosynthesis